MKKINLKIRGSRLACPVVDLSCVFPFVAWDVGQRWRDGCRITRGDLRMAKGRKGKIAKFGIFSPAVFGAKVALGESRLNKLRGKVKTDLLYMPYSRNITPGVGLHALKNYVAFFSGLRLDHAFGDAESMIGVIKPIGTWRASVAARALAAWF